MTKSLRGFYNQQIQLSDGIDREGISRVQLLRTGKFFHPKAENGVFEITPNSLLSMKNNFDNNVRRLDKAEIAVDYGHDDKGKAAGWINSVELEENNTQLWITVNWTESAEQAILAREWRFLSADLDLNYSDNENGVPIGPTLLGAGLVNRPHIKAMKAVFSEENYNEKTLKGAFSMTPEEMMKKIGELEARIKELEGMVGEKKSMLMEKEDEMSAMEKKLGGAEKQLAEANEKLETLETEVLNTKKEAKFSELLSEGKIIPAQKEAFMSMSLELSENFFKNAQSLNLSENGKGTETERDENTNTQISASEQIEKKANELIENNKNLSLSDAYSQVLSENKELAEEYDKEINS